MKNALKNFSLFRPTWLLPALICTFMLAFTGWLLHGNFLGRVENAYGDIFHQQAGKRFEPTHIAMVLIDEKSLNELSDTPLVFWTPYFAKVVHYLKQNGASVVGIDFLFSTTAEQWLRQFKQLPNSVSNYDMAWRQELADGRVVLVATTLEGKTEDQLVLPVTDMLLSLPEVSLETYVSFSNLPTDEDGAIRHFYSLPALRLPPDVDKADRPHWAFGPLLALHARNFGAVLMTHLNRPEARTIVFAGPPHTIPSVSFVDLYNLAKDNKPMPENIKKLFNGRVALIGSDYAGLNDLHTTPYGTGFFGNETKFMSGPEIQANIVEGLLSDRDVRPVSPWLLWPLLIAVLLIACFAFRYWTMGYGIAVLVALLAVAYGLGFALFNQLIEFPVATIQFGVLLSFVAIYSLRFVGETQKRKHVERMFGRYVSKDVVSQLVDSGEMPKLGGESMEVTVLFSDIRNFTTISEILQPHEVVEMINTYLSRAAECVYENGGNIDKFIGDAIMAEFGAPLRRADHALCAVKAALGIYQVAEEFAAWFNERFPQVPFPFKIGIGINSGAAIMGNIGSANKTEYTALGDTVNTASRLEGVTKSTGWAVVISEATRVAAGDSVIVGGNDRLSVKGRKEQVVVHELLGVEGVMTRIYNPSAATAASSGH